MGLAAMVLGAGKGVRMHSPLPKVAHAVCGMPMVAHVLRAVAGTGPQKTVLVVGVGREAVEEAVRGFPVEFAVQAEPRGTADAVRAGLEKLGSFEGTVLVTPGDTPLLEAETLRALVEAHEAGGHDVTVLTFRPAEPGQYGRVVRGGGGELLRIVEARDATAEEAAIGEVNSGIYCFRVAALREAIPKVRADNAQGEYYLTDVVERLARRSGAAIETEDPGSVAGINTPEQLLAAAGRMRDRILSKLLSGGVAVVDPASTYVECGVEVGAGTQIHPFTVIRRGARIGRDCVVGPFSHLRDGAVLADGVWVGAFVEVKATSMGEGSKAGHLAYLGDATLGRAVNVGAGTITANFDGKTKHHTVVEDGAQLGSGTVLVAPVRVGAGAVTGAGAVVTRGRDVAPGDVVAGVPAVSMGKDRTSRLGSEDVGS